MPFTFNKAHSLCTCVYAVSVCVVNVSVCSLGVGKRGGWGGWRVIDHGNKRHNFQNEELRRVCLVSKKRLPL